MSGILCERKERNSRFSDHLKPLMIFFRAFGIELDPSVQLSWNRKCCQEIVKFGLFFVHVFSNITFMILQFRPLFYQSLIPETSSYMASASGSRLWNGVMELCISITLAIGVHAMVLNFSHQKKWKVLWEDLRQIAEDEIHPETLEVVCRRAVVSGIVLLLVVNNNN